MICTEDLIQEHTRIDVLDAFFWAFVEHCVPARHNTVTFKKINVFNILEDSQYEISVLLYLTVHKPLNKHEQQHIDNRNKMLNEFQSIPKRMNSKAFLIPKVGIGIT